MLLFSASTSRTRPNIQKEGENGKNAQKFLPEAFQKEGTPKIL
jgi:hypothetical protein